MTDLSPTATKSAGPPPITEKNSPPADTARKLPWHILLLLGLVGTALSAAWSWNPSLWGDEAASIMSAQRSWDSLGRMLTTVDAVHGLYYSFLHLWIDVFGASPFSVRFPSALGIGAGTVGVAILGNRLARPSVGVLAAAVFMILPRSTFNGSEARQYAFITALVVWLTIYVISLVAKRETRFWPWAGFTALFALSCVLFIYTALFSVVFGAIILLMRPGRAMVLRAASAIAVGGILAIPVVYISFTERAQVAFLHSRWGYNLKNVFISPWFIDQRLAALCWGIIVIGLAIGIATLLRARTGASVNENVLELYRPAAAGLPTLLTVAGLSLVTPSVLLALGNTQTPMYSPRYLSFTSTAIALLIGLGIATISRAIRQRWVAVLLAAAIVAAATPAYLTQRGDFSKNGGTDWNAVSATLSDQASPGDAVIFDQFTRNARKPRLAKYLYPEGFEGLIDVGLKTPHQETDGLWDTVYSRADTIERLNDVPTVWLILTDERYSDDVAKRDAYIPALEDAGYTVVDEITINRTIIYKLTRG
ncbi:glycosyltransferase family 39 protein [Klugiella xanthotipulae]|uniref:glycosyltransferase family 39 protein n=1 Tax=Klugiella xanthotipulae TaxID=244735 RepID=UPI001477265F|nr:glycosyltransferase family 39 protein [Klugiella xanthotipulae]